MAKKKAEKGSAKAEEDNVVASDADASESQADVAEDSVQDELVTDVPVEMVHLRNAFYRDSYHRVMKAVLLSILVIMGLAMVLSYVILNPPRPKYFAVDENGRITPIVPLKYPNMSPPALLQWATQAAIAAYTYNYVNYRKELQAASAFFTPNGWSAFVKAVQGSTNLGAVKAKKIVMSAVARGAPVIVWQGLMNGRYAWKVQLPLLVTFQSASMLSQQYLVISMTIVRVDTVYSARGIGIGQFVAESSG